MHRKLPDLFETPGAVKRLGKEIFIQLPLLRTQTRYQPIYINAALYREFFDEEKNLSWEHMSSAVSDCFSATIEAAASTGEQIGWAYVDKQRDPLNISLAGNLGSGRAYYAGACFNIKGEKTPLAVSTKPRFSEGILEMERGIWETIVANVLTHDLEVGVPSVLAILDIHETCEVSWRDVPVKRVKIVRIDRDGALDRITHVFFNQTPFSSQMLHHTAQMFGKQEAEKFIERILHGSWSAGNISPQGHLMDFDTVCAVKGRFAQHSSSMWHRENYFGFEHEGQLKILHTMLEDKQVNIEHVRYEDLKQVFLSAMREHIAKRFLYLMGYAQTVELFNAYQGQIEALSDQFVTLARKFYAKMDSLSVKEGQCNLIHVLDFSTFSRYYPLLKRYGEFSVARALALMTDITLLTDPLTPTALAALSDEDRKYLEENVYTHFKNDYITCAWQLEAVRQQAVEFIKQYDALFSALMDEGEVDSYEIETRAYIINEDRFYMLPVFTPSAALAVNASYSPKHINRIIDLLITASKRKPTNSPEGYYSDIRLYQQGYFYILLDGAGCHQACFSFFREQFPYDNIDKDRLKFVLGGQNVDFTLYTNDETVALCTEKADNNLLLKTAYREKSLMFNDLLIMYNDNPIVMIDFLEQ